MAKVIKYELKNELIPAGPILGIISKVIDLGLQPPPPLSEDRRPRWQYGIGVELRGMNGKPSTLWITPNESLHPKSTMGKLVAAAGIKPNGEFDPEQLVSANVTALIEHKVKDGNTYANIAGFTCAPSNLQPAKAMLSDVEPPEWIRRKISNRLDTVKDPFAASPVNGVLW